MFLALIITITAGLILPLPSLLLDILIISGTIYALWLLYVVCRTKEISNLCFLPAGLLLATVFRLSLNVATSRSILSGNQPGGIIQLLGSSMLQDGIVMGLIIFLLITVILILVIAKGSERVAEVSARFTLDALPGRQMSIDADVRNGLINFEIAQQRRESLQIESRLYGALDGCMKFIKGDAIAGVVTLFVNLFGGLLIAVVIHKMEFLTALNLYSSLTVGDGLVSQVPAFLNAMTAGLLLTKIEESKEQKDRTQSFQVLSRYLFALSVLLFTLALIPGMPSFALLIVALMALVSGFIYRHKQENETLRHKDSLQKNSKQETLRIEIIGLSGEKLSNCTKRVDETLQNISTKFGVILPKIEGRDGADNLNGITFSVSLRNIKIICEQLQNEAELESFLSHNLDRLVTKNLGQLCTVETINYLLATEVNQGNTWAIKIVEQNAQIEFYKVIKNLLEEEIPILDFSLICQSFCEAIKHQAYRAKLREVRLALNLRIAAEFSTNFKIKAYALSEEFESEFRKAELENCLIADTILSLFLNELQTLDEKSILITSALGRRLIFDYLTARNLNYTVLAYEEIVRPFKIEIIGKISATEKTYYSNTLPEYVI